MQPERRPFLDVSQVASLLSWHPNTIRDHLVPIAEWKRGGTSIPSVRLGGRYFIPRWWVEEIKKLGATPPEDEEDRVALQKSTKRR